MNEFLGQLCGIVTIWLSGEPDETVLVEVDFERVETGDEHVDSQVILQAVDQMWVGNVTRSKHALTLANPRLTRNYLNATTTGGSFGLQDP